MELSWRAWNEITTTSIPYLPHQNIKIHQTYLDIFISTKFSNILVKIFRSNTYSVEFLKKDSFLQDLFDLVEKHKTKHDWFFSFDNFFVNLANL